MNLISPVRCQHKHTTNLQGGRCVSTEEHSRYNVYLCHDYGQFMIRGMVNEQYYSIDFTLIRYEDLEAAGKAVAYYNEEEPLPHLA
jgi:hypothetical protein